MRASAGQRAKLFLGWSLLFLILTRVGLSSVFQKHAARGVFQFPGILTRRWLNKRTANLHERRHVNAINTAVIIPPFGKPRFDDSEAEWHGRNRHRTSGKEAAGDFLIGAFIFTSHQQFDVTRQRLARGS